LREAPANPVAAQDVVVRGGDQAALAVTSFLHGDRLTTCRW
jgi:hypothetical protein